MKLLSRLLAVAALACMVLTPSLATAQAYPARPIRLIVPWPAGGAADFVGRVLAASMGKELGQPVIVDNKPGATGLIGINALRAQPSDGYTLILAISNTHGVAAALNPRLPYDPIHDFTAVGVAAVGPIALVVNPSLPVKTMQELVDYARQHPGKVNFASAGTGSASHLMGEMLKATTGIDIVHVPYKGTAPAVQDVAAGQVQIVFEGMAIRNYVADHRLRALATTGTRRWSALPDVPTTTEAGFPKLQTAGWFGIMGPRGMPAPVAARLDEALIAALKEPSVQAALKNQGMDVASATTPAEMNSFIASEIARWKANLKLMNYTLSE